MTWHGLFRVEGWVKCLEAEVPRCSCWPGCGEVRGGGREDARDSGVRSGEWAWSWRSGPACRSSPKVAQCPRLLRPQTHRGPHPAGPLPGVWASRCVLSDPGLEIASSVRPSWSSRLSSAPLCLPPASVLTPGEVGWERTWYHSTVVRGHLSQRWMQRLDVNCFSVVQWRKCKGEVHGAEKRGQPLLLVVAYFLSFFVFLYLLVRMKL